MAIILAGTIFHPYIFVVVFVGFLFLTLSEFYKLTEKKGFRPQQKTGLLSGIFLFLLFFLVANKIIPQRFIFLIAIIPLISFVTELFSKRKNCLKNNLITLLGIVYVALPFGLLNYIVVPGNEFSSGFFPWILAGMFFIIWINDSMAYAFGSLFGKHKIASSISPGKSWEGLIGGAVFAIIMGIINAVLFPTISMSNWIIIAFLVVTFGTCGDFFESKLKRETGVKDSGNILPGHGGMLDRFDSLLFVVPAVFVLLNLIDNI